MASTDALPESFMQEDVQLTLKVTELVDLIEAGAIAEHESGWEWPILAELRTLFTQMVQGLNEAIDEI